jgi:uncharacterized protein (DUF934 family)
MKIVDTEIDPWRRADEADTSAPGASPTRRLFTLEQWLVAHRTWPADVAAGVVLPNDADLESLAGALRRLSLIALQFPIWTDGRAYSQARLLRARLRFDGEIRAVGDVLVDMLPLLERTGFHSAELRADQSPEVARRALGYFDRYYQDALVAPTPLVERTA